MSNPMTGLKRKILIKMHKHKAKTKFAHDISLTSSDVVDKFQLNLCSSFGAS